jgi:hypothetical protein
MKTLGILAIAAALAAAVACEKDNPAFCDDAHACANGLSCNTNTNECEPNGGDLGIDLGGVDLTQACATPCSGTTPFCIGTTCLGCNAVGEGELACMTLSPGTPHCLTSGSGLGSCVQCRDANDCTGSTSTPFCDATTHVCRGCIADSECASLVCDTSAHACAAASNIVYVDCVNGADSQNGLTPATAVQKISVGVMKAMQANASFVHVAKTPGATICNLENLSLNNVNLTFVGDPPAVVSSKDMNNPAVEVKGTSKVVFRSLTFAHAIGSPAAGILVSSSMANLSVLQCTIFDNAEYGIDANNGGKVTVDRSIIGDVNGTAPNKLGGIRVSGPFTIINNFIVNNGSDVAPSGSSGGIDMRTINSITPKDIINNTIAGNHSTGLGTGISCEPVGTNANVVNNVLYNNKAQGTLSETDMCPLTYTCTDQVLSGTGNVLITSSPFVSSTDFHLAGVSTCRNAGTSNGAPPYDIDGEPRPDPTTGLVDIGADEAQ